MINIIPGTQVTVIDSRPEIMATADREIVSHLEYQMRQHGARFLLNETLQSVERCGTGVVAHLTTGKKVYGDGLLYAVGRQVSSPYESRIMSFSG